MTRAAFKIFRWRAVGVILLAFVALVICWFLFAETLIRKSAEDSLSETLGTQVDINGSLVIREGDVAVDVGDLAIADPRNPARNLLEAGTITVDLDPVPLAEKKIVIDQVQLSGLRFLTTRATPARPADPNSPAGRLLRETEAWARDKFNFPKLALGRVDTVKSLVLNPEQGSARCRRQAFLGQVDSTRAAFEQSLAALELTPLVDSAGALATRLAQTDPKKLGLAGAATPRSRCSAPSTGSNRPGNGCRRWNRPRGAPPPRRWGRASPTWMPPASAITPSPRGCSTCPALTPPTSGSRSSGSRAPTTSSRRCTTRRCCRSTCRRACSRGTGPVPSAPAWTAPPSSSQGAGYPRFLLRQGSIDLAAGQGEQHRFEASFGGITSQPALYGRPAALSAAGRIGGATPLDVTLALLSRHYGAAPTDSLVARVGGVPLPAIPLPGAALRREPRDQHPSGFSFSLSGDRLHGGWDLTSDRAAWSADTSRLRAAGLVENTVWRVVRRG